MPPPKDLVVCMALLVVCTGLSGQREAVVERMAAYLQQGGVRRVLAAWKAYVAERVGS